MNTKTLRTALSVGLLICGAAVSASTVVTFQVDMSTAAFDPGSQNVVVKGNFTPGSLPNNWSTAFLQLTNNPSGATPSIWSGATNLPFGDYVVGYKYVIESGDGFESSHTRLLTVTAAGGSVLAPLAYYNDTPPAPLSVDVTFQVDMAQQINVGKFDPLTSLVQARGPFDGWGGTVFQTNDPTILRTNQFGLVTSNVYVNTYTIVGSPGQTIPFKYHIDLNDNWESPAPGTGDPGDNNNRFFNLGSGPTQALPVLFFSDSQYAPLATNDITFQVDMSAQVSGGLLVPSTGFVEVRGDFNGWGTPQILCTNDPSALNTNIYKAVVQIIDGIGARHSYKFWSSISPNGGWEIVAKDAGLNRSCQIVSGTTLTIPPVLFSDTAAADLVSTDTVVTISVDMTGAVGTDSHVFDPQSDIVQVGGLTLNTGNWQWYAPFVTQDTPIQLTNNPVGSKIYSVDFPMTRGWPVGLTYKYGISGANDEPGGNHVRYVYTAGTYAFPLDKFGTAVVEPALPTLNAAPLAPNQVRLTWLGRVGVRLQTSSDINGPWVEHAETDGWSTTDWPTTGSKQYFRLVKP